MNQSTGFVPTRLARMSLSLLNKFIYGNRYCSTIFANCLIFFGSASTRAKSISHHVFGFEGILAAAAEFLTQRRGDAEVDTTLGAWEAAKGICWRRRPASPFQELGRIPQARQGWHRCRKHDAEDVKLRQERNHRIILWQQTSVRSYWRNWSRLTSAATEE